MQSINHNSLSKPRMSNFELLRIVAMIMIIAHHFAIHSGFNFPADTVSVLQLWVQFALIGGKIGVNIFILISGYFLINAANIKINKILKLWIQLFIYSVSIYLIFVATGRETFSGAKLFECILPVSFGGWWFASTYFVLYIISPFLNKLLRALDKKSFQKLLVIIFVMWCLIPTAINRGFESNDLLWFVFLYSVSAYVRLWHDKLNISSKVYILFSVILIALTFLSAVAFDYGYKIYYFVTYATYFYKIDCLPVFLISLFMFLGFKGMNIKYSKIINTVSAATFGIYLIHDNDFVRPFIWVDLFKSATHSDTLLLIPYSIAIIFLVFIVCMLIELIRIHLLEKNYMKLVNKAEPKIQKLNDRFFSLKVFEKI